MKIRINLSLNIEKCPIFQDWSANKKNPKSRLILIAFRLANLFTHVPLPLRYLGYPYLIFYRIFVEWILCVELPWKLCIGSGLKLDHGQALVVNDHAVIGSNCVLRHSTTIGVTSSSFNSTNCAPLIGNNVDIGSNVVILGAIKIGDGAIIGAGSVVVKDVEPDTIVVGNPARFLRFVSNNENLNKKPEM